MMTTPIPEEKVYANLVYRLAGTFRGHGADDMAYAHNEASAHRREGKRARVSMIPGGFAVYIRED